MTQQESAPPLVSLIFPAFNERENAAEMVGFFRAIVAEHPAYRFEMIVVDDGSSDATAEEIVGLARPQEPIRVVQLSRNFGSHPAVSAGLAHARGDAAITLSADRQEPLEAIRLFLDQWADGADLVWGLRSTRVQQQAVQGTFSKVFSRVFQRTSDVPTYPAEGPSQILATRIVIDTLNAMPEGNRNVLAMAAWTGFDQRRVQYEQLPRPHGVSKWTSKKKAKFAIDSFVEFSHAPLQWVGWAGLLLVVVGFLLLLTALVLVFPGLALSAGVSAICGTVLVVGGLILGAIGVLGEYVWRAGDDARRRPAFIVKQVHARAVADAEARS